MIQVKKEGILLQKTDRGFENEAVSNPGVILFENRIHLFYRAVSEGNYSSIGYCILDNPLEVAWRSSEPLLIPHYEEELHGMEDARVVRIDDLFYLTYTAFDGFNALGALAISNNLIHFDRCGIIVPQIAFDDFISLCPPKMNDKYFRYNEMSSQREIDHKVLYVWDKNTIFFPRKIDGKFYFMHRIKPDIQVVAVHQLDELTPDFWKDYIKHLDQHILLSAKHPHEQKYIGGGCPPIEIPQGWLVIYHGVHNSIQGFVYSVCVALLDLNNPQIEISRLPYALFAPEYSWELTGEVNNVCFPTGAVVINDTLYIYYGAADVSIACATICLSELIKELLIYSNNNEI